MRAAARLLASVSRPSSFLEPGSPTGITGLLTHNSPRSTLLYLYSATLDTLNKFPDHSIYRKSTEALTKHRMSVIEAAKPAGLEAWQSRVDPLVKAHPDAFRRVKAINGEGYNIVFMEQAPTQSFRSEDDFVNAPYKRKPQAEGPQFEEDVADRGRELERDTVAEEASRIHVESEPMLSMEQVQEVEEKLAAGLIEEIIEVAEGERKCAETMYENKV